MPIPTATKNLNERDDHQGQRYEYEQNMRRQDREVNSSQPSGVPGRFLAYPHMINNVARKEKRR